MSNRVVNTSYEIGPDPRVIAWLEANGIDTRAVPADQEILVTDEHVAYVEFITDADGKKVLGGNSYLKLIKTAPLISAPENHGL